MGQLKPGATYIYEQADGITYSREFGADPSTRKIIGMTWETKNLHDQLMEDQLWGQIRRAAKTNPALQNALQHAIILYTLSKNHGNIDSTET
jgi:hypothetical protein